MMTATHVTETVSLARKARHRRPRICTCCRRHIAVQIARYARRGLILAAAIAFDLAVLHQFGMI